MAKIWSNPAITGKLAGVTWDELAAVAQLVQHHAQARRMRMVKLQGPPDPMASAALVLGVALRTVHGYRAVRRDAAPALLRLLPLGGCHEHGLLQVFRALDALVHDDDATKAWWSAFTAIVLPAHASPVMRPFGVELLTTHAASALAWIVRHAPQMLATVQAMAVGLRVRRGSALAAAYLELDDAEDEDADDAEVGRPAPARRRSRGRRPLPENLPRVEIEVLPPEVVREGLDAFQRIGQVVSEVVERRPASLVVARIVRPKFVRTGEMPGTVDGDAFEAPVVQIAERLELPIERGLAGPGLLADTIVHRWQDHLPANRLEALYARDGLQLARSTICGWHEQLADLVEPLVEAMFADAFTQPYLCTDATGVLVQAKEHASAPTSGCSSRRSATSCSASRRLTTARLWIGS